jgi:hypothetical protein
MNRHAFIVMSAALLICAAIASGPANARTMNAIHHDDDKSPITLAGCIQLESEYRRQHGFGSARFGLGDGDEYILIDSQPGPVREMTATEALCSNLGNGRAYELTGSGEDRLAAYVGRRIEVTGMLKHADSDLVLDPSGAVVATEPNAGRGDLGLFEVNVASHREIPIAPPVATVIEIIKEVPAPPAPVATAGTAPAAPEPQATAPAQPEPMAAHAPRERLPRTASPLPLVGLIGLLSLAGAFAVQVQRRW